MSPMDAKAEYQRRILAGFRFGAFAIHENIAANTPFRSGRAMSSTNISPDEANPDTTPPLVDSVNPIGGAIIEKSAPGASPLTREQALAVAVGTQQSVPEGTSLMVISNNLPYIEGLENGTATKQPGHMFARFTAQDVVDTLMSEGMKEAFNV